jgi:hypothetical protein
MVEGNRITDLSEDSGIQSGLLEELHSHFTCDDANIVGVG